MYYYLKDSFGQVIKPMGTNLYNNGKEIILEFTNWSKSMYPQFIKWYNKSSLRA